METGAIRLDSIVNNAVSRTLEGLAFMDAEMAESPGTEPGSPAGYISTLDVMDPVSGKITIFVPDGLSTLITGNVFSMLEGSPTAEMVTDTVSELLNTIAGIIMGELSPASRTISLGLPETSRLSGEGPVTIPSAGSDGSSRKYCFDVHGETLTLSISYEGLGDVD